MRCCASSMRSRSWVRSIASRGRRSRSLRLGSAAAAALPPRLPGGAASSMPAAGADRPATRPCAAAPEACRRQRDRRRRHDRRCTGRSSATTPNSSSCWFAPAPTSRHENRYGVRPLWLAAVNGNAEIVLACCFEAGADPNTAVAAARRPLMTAARTGKVDALKLLDRARTSTPGDARGQTAADVGGGAQQRRGDQGCSSRAARISRSAPTILQAAAAAADSVFNSPAPTGFTRAAVRGPFRKRRRDACAPRCRRRRQRNAVGRRERAGRRRGERALGGGEPAARSRRGPERGRCGMERAAPDGA